MKYLLSILFIVLVATGVTIFFNWPEADTVQSDIIAIVNGHKLTRELAERNINSHSHPKDDDRAILDTIIVNELLLQEAQRRNIHKEASFRTSVQNYYEQSLIKILIDRQFGGMDTKVTGEEIDRYIANHSKIFSYTRLTDNSPGKFNQSGQSKSVLFDDLSNFLKLTLGSMEVGDIVADSFVGGKVTYLRLDAVEPGPTPSPVTDSRSSIREIIKNYKKERALTAWIEELRNQATITIPVRTDKP